MTPSRYAELRVQEIGRRVGVQLSKPAERVNVHCELNTMRFSRSLDERNPYTRSGQAWIVSEDHLRSEFNLATYILYVIAAGVAAAFLWGYL